MGRFTLTFHGLSGMCEDDPDYAWYLCFDDADPGLDYYNRYYCQSVRPVRVVPE